MVSAETKSRINTLEYWLLKPFTTLEDREGPYVKHVVGSLQLLQTATPYSEEYDRLLATLEAAYEENKMKYQYVERRQTEKAMKVMMSTVINRMISQKVIPVTNKITEKVGPVVKQTMDGTVIPAADKTLRFLHKVFVKKNVEAKEVTPEPSQEVVQEPTE